MWAAAGGLTTALFLATGNVLARMGLMGSNPLTGTLITIFVNTIALWFLSLFLTAWDLVRWGLIWIFMLDGLTVPAFARLLKFAGMEAIGLARTSAIMASTPMFAVLFGTLLWRERPGPLIIFGTLLIVLGIALLSERGGRGGGNVRGVFFALGSSLLFGLSPTIKKWGVSNIPFPLLGAAISSTTSLIIIFIISRFFEKGVRLSLGPRSMRYYILSGIAFAAAFAVQFWALKIGRVVVVGPLSNISGLFSVLYAQLLLSQEEKVGLRVWAGAISIIAGATSIVFGRA